MKVDLTPSALPASDPSQVRKPVHTDEAGSSAPGSSEDLDKVTLSLDSSGIASLQATALSQPEIRSDKVQALKQAIASGQYKLEPDKIAQAIVNDSELKD
jgi:negative regulator of flagellin synthesis FlgM